jgi:hypothetical protein
LSENYGQTSRLFFKIRCQAIEFPLVQREQEDGGDDLSETAAELKQLLLAFFLDFDLNRALDEIATTTFAASPQGCHPTGAIGATHDRL